MLADSGPATLAWIQRPTTSRTYGSVGATFTCAAVACRSSWVRWFVFGRLWLCRAEGRHDESGQVRHASNGGSSRRAFAVPTPQARHRQRAPPDRLRHLSAPSPLAARRPEIVEGERHGPPPTRAIHCESAGRRAKGTAVTPDVRQRRKAALDLKIKACRKCRHPDQLNEPGVTESAPGFGSLYSPVAIV